MEIYIVTIIKQEDDINYLFRTLSTSHLVPVLVLADYFQQNQTLIRYSFRQMTLSTTATSTRQNVCILPHNTFFSNILNNEI